MFVYESVPGTAVTNLSVSAEGIEFVVEGPEDAQITLELSPDTLYDVKVGDSDAGEMKTNLGGKMTVGVELGEAPVSVKILQK